MKNIFQYEFNHNWLLKKYTRSSDEFSILGEDS